MGGRGVCGGGRAVCVSGGIGCVCVMLGGRGVCGGEGGVEFGGVELGGRGGSVCVRWNRVCVCVMTKLNQLHAIDVFHITKTGRVLPCTIYCIYTRRGDFPYIIQFAIP